MAGPDAQSATETSGNLPDHPTYRKISPHFPFLELPPEIRVIIYEYLLVFPDNENGGLRIELHPDTEASERSCRAASDSSVVRNRALNILLVSKAVFSEAGKVFYSDCNFNFDDKPDNPDGKFESILICQAFLTARSSFTLKYITSVAFTIHLDWMADKNPNAKVLGSLVNTLNTDLPAFEQLGLTLYGSCPETRRTPWNWYPPNDKHDHPQKWFGVLLELRKVKYLLINYKDFEPYDLYPYDDEDLEFAKERIGRSVAFVSFLRAHLLKNAGELGTRNILVYSRHIATFTQERWKRKMDRISIIICYDDENGKSIQEKSAMRPSPLHIGVLEKCVKEGKDPKEFEEELRVNIVANDDDLGYSIFSRNLFLEGALELGMSDTEDWDVSDGGDNDSLKDVDLGSFDCTFITDEEFFKTYHQLPG
ncbi:hypothetical protein BFW01_g9372 [Lasiodiplodia theobromae]|uniref:F-box domain-containing protein n=1 Tax=Lasiodiplodia theobromae TaxID=45133 RepID=A0A5N5DJH3_9PEZI|nr:uncharacterized protein LTHEOB_11142 [Lasiodiplodia theobromae]KAB2578025.1 hypothetical protein DBV05_g3409 [Lasiodiplodia theobromae]KAF4538017.1 hypothetical protein LTHEOB_11142 [Lasiodiplodia theobromae]KAF9638475.1 hypothetical protein BFW01_g9372 [Lasiodiplodia theobromae]